MMRWRFVLVLAASLALSGCATAVPLVASVPALVENAMRPVEPESVLVADPGTGPGSIVSAETMPNLPWSSTRGGMNAVRVVYRSTQGSDAASTEVSGSVFVPDGEAPEGGWPVVSFAHGTTGIDIDCGPSVRRDMYGLSALAAGYTQAGYAVAITDYQGLGNPGVHGYLDNPTAGYNMIDAVRALRHTFPDVSDRWVAFGSSQGGGAAWAANEQSAYAPELDLVGSVSLVPAANMVGLVDKAEQGTLTEDQAPLMQWVIESLARGHSDIDRDDYRTGAAAQDWDALTGCTADKASARSEAAARIGQLDFAPASAEADALLRKYLEDMAVPQQKASAPMLVAYGDADTYIDAAWTDAAVAAACAMGDVVAIDRQPGKGHADIDGTAVNEWIGKRFAGEPAVDDCTR